MKRLIALALAALLALTGCGGGGVAVFDTGGGDSGGVGSGGTGAVAVGSIEGFASIIVNGVRFDTSGAEVRVVDSPALALGMTVGVTGVVASDLATGTATLVLSAAELRGAVSAVQRGNGSFTLQSMQVGTDASTAYDGLRSLDELDAGDWVQVYGLPVGVDGLRATRIERVPPGAEGILTGVITALDRNARTVRVGPRTVAYGNARIALPEGAASLQPGQTVRVRGRDAVPASAPWRAASIEPWYTVTTQEGSRAAVSGLVSDFSGPGFFRVGDVVVDASSATVTGGAARNLGNGLRVEVAGLLRGGVLVADRVRLRAAPGAGDAVAFSATGPVGAFESAARFRVQGQWVDASAARFTGGTAADLGPGRRVRVTGSRVENGALIADEVAFL